MMGSSEIYFSLYHILKGFSRAGIYIYTLLIFLLLLLFHVIFRFGAEPMIHAQPTREQGILTSFVWANSLPLFVTLWLYRHCIVTPSQRDIDGSALHLLPLCADQHLDLWQTCHEHVVPQPGDRLESAMWFLSWQMFSVQGLRLWSISIPSSSFTQTFSKVPVTRIRSRCTVQCHQQQVTSSEVPGSFCYPLLLAGWRGSIYSGKTGISWLLVAHRAAHTADIFDGNII